MKLIVNINVESVGGIGGDFFTESTLTSLLRDKYFRDVMQITIESHLTEAIFLAGNVPVDINVNIQLDEASTIPDDIMSLTAPKRDRMKN